MDRAPSAPCVDDGVVGTIKAASLRRRCDVVARVVSLEATKLPMTMLDVVVDDGTGRLRCSFFGREAIPAVVSGRWLRVTGRVVRFRGRKCLLNPAYELCDGPGASSATSS